MNAHADNANHYVNHYVKRAHINPDMKVAFLQFYMYDLNRKNRF